MAQLDALAAPHAAALSDVTTLATSDLVDWWSTVDTSDVDKAIGATRDVLPLIVDQYAPMAAELAAAFYDDLRAAANAPGTFGADVDASITNADQIDALAGYGTGPLRAVIPLPADALSLLAGGLQRLVANADRTTIARNVTRDKAGPVYARHASANACAFCAMLATRDAVYGSKQAATRVVGRGRSHLTRGAQASGDRFHDHCHCVAVPVWPDQQVDRAPYVTAWDSAYNDAVKAVGTNTSDVLAHMRGTLGTG